MRGSYTEEALRIQEEDWRHRRENESYINSMIMTVMMTVALDAVSRLAPLVEEITNTGETKETSSTLDEKVMRVQLPSSRV